MNPIYDIHKTYLENAEEGPFFKGALPKRLLPPQEQWIELFGYRIASAIGVPAGPLLNARWVALAAKLGFDIVTYKTIRSQQHPAHPLPNMVYVDADHQLQPHEEGSILHVATHPPRTMEELSLTNSFGIPSRDPEYLIADIARAEAALGPGQLMIVSVVGTVRPNEDFFLDFARAAELAIAGGAKVIEADLSCPNVVTAEGSLYTDPEALLKLTRIMKRAIGDRPLILKMGMINDKETMRKVAHSAALGGASALAGINTLSMQVVDSTGKAALGEKRLRAGVCGRPIREAALSFVRLAHEVIVEEKFDLLLLGTGGVTDYTHLDDLFTAGADVAMSALGMMWDPYIADRYHQMGKKPWIK